MLIVQNGGLQERSHGQRSPAQMVPRPMDFAAGLMVVRMVVMRMRMQIGVKLLVRQRAAVQMLMQGVQLAGGQMIGMGIWYALAELQLLMLLQLLLQLLVLLLALLLIVVGGSGGGCMPENVGN